MVYCSVSYNHKICTYIQQSASLLKGTCKINQNVFVLYPYALSEVLRFGSEGERADRGHWQPGHCPVHERDPPQWAWILPVLLDH